jgi:hypothetical protein
MNRTRKTPPEFLLGDTVCYMPTGWYYVVIGADSSGYDLEALLDAPNIWRTVEAENLRLVVR